MEIQQVWKQVEQKNKIIYEKDQELQQKDQQLQQQIQQLRQQEQQLQEQEQEIQQQELEIQQQEDEIEQKNQELQEKDKQITEKDQEIQQKDQLFHDQQLQGSRDDDKPNWVVNRQEISVSEKLLGTGGWGSVREGTFRGCKVAVKCIDNEIISPYNLRLFSREMDMAARCRHPNLMQFIAATDEGVPLIVTELMHTSLRKILQQSQLHSNQIIPILLGAACGLNYLHKTTPNPILHRDISSANVLLNPLPNNQWHAKLSDFGSANFMRASNTVGAGNPSYAAPEALKPEGPHTPAMDVFSFGVLMYEMCSREFPADKPNPSMLNNVKWDVIEIRLVGMIRSCLSHDIQGRPSMDDLIYGLNR